MRTIENKTNSSIILIFKVIGAECVGNKITINPKESVVVSHTIDVIEIVEH